MLVIAISTRALFDFTEENKVYEEQGLQAYQAYQRSHEEKALNKGVCFNLVKKLLNLNTLSEQPLVEVILCSRNSADSGLRVFNSIHHYQLGITRAIFTDGQAVHDYLKAFAVHLFLSANHNDVKACLDIGIAAASIITDHRHDTNTVEDEQLRIAFDGDCVLFSDEIEKITQEHGLQAFSDNEKKHARALLPNGPFANFVREFSQMQKKLKHQAKIRTALVTARSAPAHERVIRTLRAWEVDIDESFFLGKHDKSEILAVYKPDIFFDDILANCQRSSKQQVPSGHVPYGITNA